MQKSSPSAGPTGATNRLPDATEKRSSTAQLWSFLLALILIGLSSPRAYSDVGVILNESLDTSVARITGSGHSAVYFSNICPETPVKLRLCHQGELGSVMSNYISLGEDQSFEWNVVPFNVYLYGVENARYRPLVGSQQIKHVLEERYRENYLADYCATEFCKTSNKAEWREMVGATQERSMYVFVMATTTDQDREMIEQFNSAPNKNHFNGVTRNCADFTRKVINAYFPGATGPDYINDFGMTSPKAIARSFTRYAKRHPEAHFRVLHFAQVPGTIKRSTVARAGTEQLFRSKKLLIPMAIFAEQALPFVAGSYLLTGRFDPQNELEKHPTVEATELDHQVRLAKAEDDEQRAQQLETELNQQRSKVMGTGKQWKKYRKQFDAMIAEETRRDTIPEQSLNRFFHHLNETGTPVAEDNGALWMEVSEGDELSRVGLSANNLFSSGSDPELAHQLLLARIEKILKSPKHGRENMLEFKADWNLLQSAPSYSARFNDRSGATPGSLNTGSGGNMFLTRQ
jgi:hypothetical protein